MKTKIEIECDTIFEVYQHLRVISRQIRSEVKKQNLNAHEEEFPKRTKFYDNNCYGIHDVDIKPY